MKKSMGLLLAITLAFTCAASPALSEEEYSFSGKLQPQSVMTIVAPFDGTVTACSPKAGDLVAQGDALATLDTTRVYAPCDGTVAAVFAAQGDALSDVLKVYEAAVFIEPASTLTLDASTASAYNSLETKYVHVGENVRLYSSASDEREGAGVVISVSGTSYVVEVLSGNLRIGESCHVSRSEERGATRQRVGGGRTRRSDPVAVTADESVLKLYVRQGAAVRKGDLLMETVPGDLKNVAATDASVYASADCVILSAPASVGASMKQGQPMFTAYAAGTLEAVVQVDENDLDAVAVGGAATIELDGADDRPAIDGTVRAVSHVPTEGASGVSYDVYVTFENDDYVRQGMSVTVVVGR